MSPPTSDRGKRLAALVAMLLVCGSLRLWLVACSDLISRDGTSLVASARRFAHDAGAEIKTSAFHPAYPACLVAVRRVLLTFGADPGAVDTWDMAGQIVSLVAAIAATLGLWFFAERVFCWRIAFLGVLLMSLTRKWSVLGADVLTDALAICFQIWGAVLALTVAQHLADGKKRAVAWAVAAGGCSAGAYLVRPEAIVIAPMAVSLWLTNLLRKRAPWRLSLAAVLAAVIALALCAGPYMLTIGSFSRKTSVQQFASLPEATPSEAALWPVAAAAADRDSGLHQFFDQLTISLHLILSALAAVCLVTWLCTLSRRFRPSNRVRIFPSHNGTLLMLAAIILTAGPLMHYGGTRKLSHRYLMFQALLLSPLAGAGLAIIGQWLRIAADKIDRPAARARRLFALGVVALALGLGAHSLHPLHGDKGNFRSAAAFVHSITTPDDYVASTEQWILHYSDRPGWFILTEYLTRRGSLPHFLRGFNVTHFVFCQHSNPKKGEREVHLNTPHLVCIRTFPPDDPSGTTITVYRVERGEWGPRKPKKK